MERNEWNRESDRYEGGRYRDQAPRPDEDSYRGAYRLDTSSDHRNVSTWDWDRDRQNRRDNDYNQDYNRDYNRNYNSDYNRDYNHIDRNRGYDQDNYNPDSRYYRDQDRRERNSYRDEQYGPAGGRYGNRFGEEPGREHRSVHDRIAHRERGALSSFNAHYEPDHYGQGGGANYGNEAGSLSYGYDGSSNYDPDWNRQYNPLTGRLSGHRPSYHGNYTSRHPGQSRSPYEGQR